MRRAVFLTVVVPAYNEEERIGRTLSEIGDFFAGKGIPFEVVVVDDGSTDRTSAVVRRVGRMIRYVRLYRMKANLGKGAAVKTGVMGARGRLTLVSDADLAVPLTEFDRLWKKVPTGCDVAIGSRREGGKVVRGQGVVRSFLGRGFRLLIRTLVLSGISDTQCGFKLLRTGLGKRAFREVATTGVLYDVEFLLAVRRLGGRICEVPVSWSHDPRTRISYTLISAVGVFWELLRIKWRWRLVLPEGVRQG